MLSGISVELGTYLMLSSRFIIFICRGTHSFHASLMSAWNSHGMNFSPAEVWVPHQSVSAFATPLPISFHIRNASEFISPRSTKPHTEHDVISRVFKLYSIFAKKWRHYLHRNQHMPLIEILANSAWYQNVIPWNFVLN